MLTRAQWEALYQRVRQLDAEMVLRTIEDRHLLPSRLLPDGRILAKGTTEVCPAWVMDENEFGTCEGVWKQDHVKDEPRIARKADDDEDHLVNLCGAHDERGMLAGRIWNTANRPLEREYLLERRRISPSLPALGGVDDASLDVGKAPARDPHDGGDGGLGAR